MTLNEYAEKAMVTRHYPTVDGQNLVYPALKLAGEAGEYADKVGKEWRNSGQFPSAVNLNAAQRKEWIKELGDVLWYIAASAYELGYTLEYVAKVNLEKLADREKRGVICGEGDNR